VERGGGIVSLRLLNDTMRSVQRGTDKTAAELAIRRLTDELKGCDEEERRLAALRTESDKRWDEHFVNLRSRNRTVPVLIVGLIVLALLVFVAQEVPTSFRPIATALAVAASIALTVYLWLTIGRGFRRALAEDYARRDELNAGDDTLLATARGKTAQIRERLNAQRRLVD
jgi:Arc/MetJ family transcription regulator